MIVKDKLIGVYAANMYIFKEVFLITVFMEEWCHVLQLQGDEDWRNNASTTQTTQTTQTLWNIQTFVFMSDI